METKLALCLLLLVLYMVEESEQRLSRVQAKRLENIKDTADFIRRFLRLSSPAQVASQLAPFDSCEPRDTSVTLPQPAAAQEMYWPSCTKVKRCGGCACSSMSECVPTPEGKQPVKVQVARCKADGDSFKILGIDLVVTETHTSCMCECKVKESDCNLTIHRHDRDTCQCKCHNAADATKCSSDRKWNGTTCSCECKDVYLCHRSEYFSHDTCRCEVAKPSPPTITDPCAFKTCGFGYVKQVYRDLCRCVVAPRPRRPCRRLRYSRRPNRRGSSLLSCAPGRRYRG